MPDPRRETTVAIFLFLAAQFGNVLIFTIVPFLSGADYAPLRRHYALMLGLGTGDGAPLSAFQIMLCYSTIATLCMLPWALKQGWSGLKTTRIKIYGLRGVLEYTAFTLSFFSLTHLGEHFTLPMHMALSFLSPLIATVAAIVILKEKSRSHTWVALLVGMVGVLVVTRPGMIPLSPGVLYVLGSALAFSFCGVVIKLLTRTESPRHVAFYMLGMTMLLAIPAGVTHWRNPGLDGWFWLAVIGVIAFLQQIYVAKAIGKVAYTILIPLNFLCLLFTTFLSYVVYAKMIDGWTFAGALLILASTVYSAYRNRASAQKETLQATLV